MFQNCQWNMGRKYHFVRQANSLGFIMGKGTEIFDSYLHYCSKHPYDKSLRGSNNHSTVGGKFI